ncbi:antitoxin VbhA family protein [Desulfuribacillus alkaliarsenatis]|uniref:antitoxin VbhA family protein n=1 Tax=Desulfuribacillus alkaliarsenatis TaxID=766136 RepID=UPI0009FD784E
MNKIEGVKVSSQAQKLSAKWARGEISGAEMKASLVAKYKHFALGSNNERSIPLQRRLCFTQFVKYP